MDQGIPVSMHRPHLKDIPQYDLPAGYSFRPYAVGDAGLWVDVQAAANADTLRVTRDTFQNDFGKDEELLPDRSWFVVDPSGKDVASITAWWRRLPDGREQGLIHWVAVLPQCQGKGIGKAMMTRAMGRLAHAYDDVYLNTSSRRAAAIKVYLDFGFLPDMAKDRAAEGWADLRSRLKHRLLGNA